MSHGFQADQRIGPLALIRKLGFGSFGEVWLAKRLDVLAAPPVAVKLPFDPQSDLEAIRREVELAISASGHPNIVPVHEFNVYDGQVVIVSEYVEGGNLHDWLLKFGGKAPSVERAVEIVGSILTGLHYLHTRKPPIIHCDLKPENIMMQSEIPRLTDFGISRFSRTTAFTRQFTGTLAYMSPEAFKGGYPPQRDLWAVGVILYLLLAGRLPFPQDDAPQVMAAILTEDPPPLPDPIPAPIRAVVTKALNRDPAQRFASAEEMRAALLQTAFAPQAAVLPPSQKMTVDASAVVLPPQQPTAGGPSPVASDQKTMDSRVVPLPSRPVKVISHRQAKLDAQKNNRRALAALGLVGVLAAGLWTVLRLPKANATVKPPPVVPTLPAQAPAVVTGEQTSRLQQAENAAQEKIDAARQWEQQKQAEASEWAERQREQLAQQAAVNRWQQQQYAAQMAQRWQMALARQRQYSQYPRNTGYTGYPQGNTGRTGFPLGGGQGNYAPIPPGVGSNPFGGTGGGRGFGQGLGGTVSGFGGRGSGSGNFGGMGSGRVYGGMGHGTVYGGTGGYR